MKYFKIAALYVIGLALVTGCQSNEYTEVEVKMKSDEELKEIADTYTYEDYLGILEKAVIQANEFHEDEELHKWITRVLAQEKLYYETDLTEKQVITLAQNDFEKDKAWKAIAEEKYGVTVTEAEVDDYIKEGPDTLDLPLHQAYAEVLGLSSEELNHQYDRDIYKKNVMWLKLKPKLEKKYGITDNNKQIEKYEEEVEKRLR
ncbi:MAG: hypothetical protein ACQEUT_11935 [Bacillota bacterium]